jgi:hypothetical protein
LRHAATAVSLCAGSRERIRKFTSLTKLNRENA